MSTPEEVDAKAAMDKARADLAAGMMEVSSLLEPIYDTADGMRANLRARGWSEPAAEQAALVWLGGVLAKLAGGMA